MHIPIKCSTCQYYATGVADGENSLDNEALKTTLCTRFGSYDVVCHKAYLKNGCPYYHLNWGIYNMLRQAHKQLNNQDYERIYKTL